ncbi:uncharacterized protein LOC117258611 isoform X2 [Epinephelus lanceolatus]
MSSVRLERETHLFTRRDICCFSTTEVGDDDIRDDITYSDVNISRNLQQPIRQSKESDPAAVYSAVRRADDVSYRQIVFKDIRSNRKREPPAEPQVIYSSLR